MKSSLVFLAFVICYTVVLARNLQVVQPSALSSASLPKVQVIKSQLDPVNYTVYKLPNDMNFMVVIDPAIQTDMLYAWSVHSGQIDVPAQYPGIELVLADAILYGSKKYPALDTYGNFIAPAEMNGTRQLHLQSMTLVQGGPSSMSTEIVSRVTDILVNPLLSNIAVGQGLQNAARTSTYYSRQTNIRVLLPILFIEFFCISEYSRVFVPQIVSSLKNHNTEDYGDQVRKYFNTFVSSDISSAAIMLAEWNQTLIDDAIGQLSQMVNRKALPKLYNQSVLKKITQTTPLYYLINSRSKQTGLFIRIIPTHPDNDKHTFDQVMILSELMESSDGLLDTLKAKFNQIDGLDKKNRFISKYNYASIELFITFKQGESVSTIPQKIYAYVSGYMAQNWGKIYTSEVNKIIDSLNYKFLVSPFTSNDQINKLNNIVFHMGFDTPTRALNALFSIDKSKILSLDEKVQHQFKIVGLEMGSFEDNGDGIDSIFKMKYKAVKISEPIPTVPPPVFTPNPYAFIPAAQFTGYPNQTWPSFQKGSAIFYPNPHSNQPFSSVSCIIHFKPPSPVFAELFLKMVWQKIQKDVRLVRQVQLIPQWDLNQVTVQQTGTVTSIFKFLGVFFEGILASFSEDLFNDAKSTFAAQLKTYNSRKGIEDIAKNDQILVENPAQSSLDSKASFLASYNLATFLTEQTKFLDGMSVEWLILGFKETNDDIQKNIDVLNKKYALRAYTPPSPLTFATYTKSFTRSGSSSSSVLYFLDFGKKSLNSFLMAKLYETLSNSEIGSFTNPSNINLSGYIHFTSSGKIGFNLVASSSKDDSAALQTFLDSYLKFVQSKEQISFLQNNFNSIRQSTQKALTFNPVPKDMQTTVNVLNDYVTTGCYECLLTWPSQITSSITAITFQQLQTAWRAAVTSKSTIIEQS